MENDGKIYITISDERGSGSKSAKEKLTPEQKKEKEKQKAIDYATHRFYNFIESEAKTMVRYSMSNIGNFTGDYDYQRDVNSTLSVASSLMNIGMSIKAGLVATGGNPLGAVAGLVVSVGSQLINYGLQERANAFQTYKQNYNIEKLRDLSGLNNLTNGGRI